MPDRDFVSSSDLRFAVQLPPDGAVVPAKETGEPGLAARAALVVERDGDGPQVGGGDGCGSQPVNQGLMLTSPCIP